jgi:hypothetical protein
MKDNILILLDNNISAIIVGLNLYDDLRITNSEFIMNVDTIELNKTASAYLYDCEIFLNLNMKPHVFKYGIRKDNKMNWSIPISSNITSKELEKIIKLKNFW